jgi:hypothetical protein
MRKIKIISMVFIILVSIASIFAQEIDAKKKCLLKLALDFKERKLSIEDIYYPDNRNAANGEIVVIKAKPMSSIRFLIKNINLNKYDVKISDSIAEENEFEIPEIFSQLFVSSLGTASKTIPKSGAKTMLGSNYFDTFVENKKKLDELMVFIEAVSNISKTAEDLNSMRTKIDEKVAIIESDFLRVQGIVRSAWSQPDNIKKIFCQAKEYLKTMIENKLEFEGTSDPNKTAHGFIVDAMKRSIENSLEFDKQIDKISKTLISYFEGDLAQKMFSYTPTKSNFFQGGELTLKVEIFEKSDEKKGNALYRVDIIFHSARKLFIVEPSAGFMISRLHDFSFSLENGAIIRKGSEDIATLGVGALLHFSLRLCDDFSFGVSTGLAPSNTSGNFQYYFGLSAGIGDNKKIFITVGYAFGKVNRLTGYDERDLFDGKSEDIPMMSSMQHALFLGISYDFLSTKNANQKEQEKKN